MGIYHVSLEQFTGPLDLLLHLVRVNEMDIFDLDVAHITDQYVQVIEAEGVRDLAGAYHFLAMAATLIELKSRLLLPQHESDKADDEDGQEPPEDPRELLARQLAAYQSIQDVTNELSARYEQTGRHWPRQVLEKLEAEIVYTMDSLSVYDLMVSFQEVLSRPRFQQITIFKEDYDLDEARDWLRGRTKSGPASLKSILLEQEDIYALIVTFIALLDLIKEEELLFETGSEGIQILPAPTADVL
ncbi:segregation/condensation protein A [bacterium]|nr:segregation/condensation protein A [bacterium]